MENLELLISPLRPLLQPITHNLPAPLVELGVSLLGAACYQTIVRDLQPEAGCSRLAASKGLGVLIVAASAVVKVPQLLKLVRSKSSAGLSFPAYLLETCSFLVSLAYNSRQRFPFSTYGETAFIAVQNVAIAALVLYYRGRSAGAATFVAGIALVGYSLFNSSIVTADTMTQLMAGAGLLGLASKVPQILTIWQQGGTGQLSAFAVRRVTTSSNHMSQVSKLIVFQVFTYLFGSLSRIFTTLQEVDDPLILYSFIAAFVLNAVLAAQMVYHWNSPSTATHAGEMGEKPGRIAHQVPAALTSSSQPKTKGPTTRRRG